MSRSQKVALEEIEDRMAAATSQANQEFLKELKTETQKQFTDLKADMKLEINAAIASHKKEILKRIEELETDVIT